MLALPIKYKELSIITTLGLILWMLPTPNGLDIKAWHMFVIFSATILAIVINPIPTGAIALLGILIAVLTKTLTIKEALGGFGTSFIWLVVFAFLISRGFVKTGLGKRIAYYFISKLGRSTLGLSYGLVLTDFILAPMIPSVTARGGGIVFPIAKALCEEYGKEGNAGLLSKNRTAGFIMQVCFQGNVITSAMFLTAMAGNPLAVTLAATMGIKITWANWALGAIVPGIICLILLPLILYLAFPPTVKVIEEAPARAKEILKSMGKITSHEIIMMISFVLLISCWILGEDIGIDATTTALMGVSILLLTGIVSWNDVLHEKSAWDTLIWFATLVMMSDYLSKFGMMKWIGGHLELFINSDALYLSAFLLILFYFYIHYIFAGSTAHITVFFATFLMIFTKLGFPALPSALMLAYLSSISAGLTHFGTASAPVYFEAGYLSTKDWWKVGALSGLCNLIIWLSIGGLWWKILGWI